MKINDKLYRTTSFVKYFEYTVVGIIDRGGGKMFEIECNQCDDHSPCRVIVKKESDKNYQYHEMENNDDEHYWHNDGFYRLTKQEAINDAYRKSINDSEKEIEKAKSNIEYHKKSINSLLPLIKN